MIVVSSSSLEARSRYPSRVADSIAFGNLLQGFTPHTMSKPIAGKLGGGKAPRLSEVHCDRDSVCVKTDT